jgi:hypothetical protein
MAPFDYISLLTSIVLALGITRTLSGLGKLLQSRGRLRAYWVHSAWGVNMLLWLLLNWWILYRWHTQERWTFFLFIFVLVSPVIAFLLSVFLFPEPLEDGTDLKHHFYQNRRWFFALAALLPPLDAVDTLLKGWAHFQAQGPIYIFTILILLTLSITGFFTPRERFHAFYAVFFMAYILAFIGINLLLLT